MDAPVGTPPPPPGFTLDSGPPAPPAGFKLDPPAQAPQSPPAASSASGSSVLERIGSGIADPVWGAMQLGAHVLPGVDAKIVDQMVKDRETEYQADRKAGGSKGFDWSRLVGNIVNPVNFVAPAAAGLSVPARIGAGAAVGSTVSALAPVTQNTEEFGKEKTKQGLIGLAAGGAVPAVGAAASRVIWPRVDAAVQQLTERGITPTIGQILGGVAKTTEEKLTSMPIVGDIIGMAQRGATNDMNRALYNMALEPIGGRSTAAVGREGVREVRDRLSDAYTNLLRGRTTTLDGQFSTDVADVWQRISPIMSNDAREQFRNILTNRVLNLRQQNGHVDAELMKALDTQLGQLNSRFRRTQDVNSQMIGEGLMGVQAALRNAVGRSNPDMAADLARINEGWSIYARIRNAAARTGSTEGVVLPSTLDSAVRALDNTVARGGTATGTAPMREFADAVRTTLGNNYRDSGTAGRMFLNLLFAGGAMHLNPVSLIAMGAASIPYLPGARQATAAALTRRPDIAQPIAQGVERAAQLAAPGVAMDASRR